MNRTASLALSMALFATFVGGCSSSSASGTTSAPAYSAADLTAVCTRWVGCNAFESGGESYCELKFRGWIVPAGCVSATQAASCDELVASFKANGSLWPTTPSICFPPCTDKLTATCANDESTYCDSNGVSTTDDCAAECAGDQMTYTGTCGTSYGGQTSSFAKCWCK